MNWMTRQHQSGPPTRDRFGNPVPALTTFLVHNLAEEATLSVLDYMRK
jgi:hypothetical protein